MLPCSASSSNLFCYVVCALVVCTAGMLLVLNGILEGAGVPKDRRMGAPVGGLNRMKGVPFRRSLWSSVASIVCCPLPLGGSSPSRCGDVPVYSSMVLSST